MLRSLGLAFDAVNHPLEHAHVVTVAGPNKLAVDSLAEPVHTVDLGQGVAGVFQLVLHVQPMLEVVAHVVAAEGQHGKRVAAHHALLAKSGCGGLGTHGGGHVHAFHPGAGFGHQWHGGGATATEDESVDRNAVRVVPLRIKCRVVDGCHGKA